MKRLRKLLNLSQFEFCGFLDVNQSQLSKMERGEQEIAASQLCCLSSIFRVDIFWFFDEIRIDLQKGSGSDPDSFGAIQYIGGLRPRR